MAEVVKAKKRQQLVDLEKNEEKAKKIKVSKMDSKKSTPKNDKKQAEKKKSLWEKFMIFCDGVKSEIKKVRWTSKTDMMKYSVATIVFILFCSMFFYAIDAIFALIQSLFK